MVRRNNELVKEGIGGLIIMTMLCSCSMVGNTEKVPIPTMTAVVATQPPVIDGKLDDKVWEQSVKTTEFVNYKTALPVKEKTIAYLLYDKDHLHIGFKCWESQMSKLKTDIMQENGPVWLDDCVEIFIKTFKYRSNYYHFAVNARGTKYSRYGTYSADADKGVSWTVKTFQDKDFWTTEISIPFKSLKVVTTSPHPWYINFGREEQPSQEVSCWSPTYDSFHNTARYGKLTGLNAFGSITCAGKPVITQSRNKTTGIKPVDKIYATPTPPLVIIPAPAKMKLLATGFKLNPETVIVVQENREEKAAKELVEEIKFVTGIELKIIKVTELGNRKNNFIILGEPTKNNVIKSMTTEVGLKIDDKTPGSEGYGLKVTKEKVVVSGSDEQGTYYGVQTLKQLIKPNSEITGVEIYDYPVFKYRGTYFIVDKDSLWYHGKMITDVLSRLKINNIMVQCEQGVQWESCPKIVPPMAASKDDIKKLVNIAKEHYMKVIPVIPGPGHIEYVFKNDKTNLEFVEDPNRPYAYCPLNPKSYEFIFGMMDEAIELFDQPEYLNIAHDEHDMVGEFPYHEECKKIGNAGLFYMDTLKIYQHLKDKGVKTMIWTDKLLQKEFKEKINEIPKDVVMCDWHYWPEKEYPSIDFFQQNGYPVMACTWYVKRNIEEFAVYGEAKKILGLLQTTWAGIHGNATQLVREYDQISAYVLAADFAWSGKRRSLNKLGYRPDEVLNKLWLKKSYGEQRPGFVIDVSSYCNISFVDKPEKYGWLGEGEQKDLSGLPVGQQRMVDGVIYNILDPNENGATAIALYATELGDQFPERVTLPMMKKTNELRFLHTTGYDIKKNTPVANYIVRYTDGSEQKIKIVYGVNVHCWLTDEPGIDLQLAWEGKTKGEEKIILHSLVWHNPNPDKEIKEIELVSSKTVAMPIILAVTGLE